MPDHDGLGLVADMEELSQQASMGALTEARSAACNDTEKGTALAAFLLGAGERTKVHIRTPPSLGQVKRCKMFLPPNP